MKILTVLGARPQFIKASVVSNTIARFSELKELMIHTGQHFDKTMSDVFFTELGMVPPAYFLGVNGGGHGAMTGRMLAEIERVLLDEMPDIVLVYGDTNSTLAGALAAAKLHIPVAHVEAGLRSFNMKMPEEVNRVLTDRVSKWLFAPTSAAVGHLNREGIGADLIHQVGDVMFDVALHHGQRADSGVGVLAQLGIASRSYVLVTVHRAENTDSIEKLQVIVEAVCSLAGTLPIVWPLHPRTRGVLDRAGLSGPLSKGKVKVIDPVGYLDMVRLEKHAAVIATDSGGVQKEAFFHRVPCVTLREETEWPELVEAGWNRLVSPARAEEVVSRILDAVGVEGIDVVPYGSGDAAERIVDILRKG